jgi:PAS domain S-box-containing protein
MKFISDGCFPLTGYSANELIGDRKLSYSEIIHKDDREMVNDSVQYAIENNEPFTLLYRIITAEGIVKWVWEKGRGVFDSKGNLLHLEGFISDITERKVAEEKSIVLAQALKSVSESVFIINLNKRIIFVNQALCKTYGYLQSELIGQDISILLPELKDPKFLNDVAPKPFTPGWAGELINVKKNGEQFPIHLSNSVISDEFGKTIALAGVIVDITQRRNYEYELKTAKERAEELSRIKGNFLTQISHELRTPLVAILGFAEIIKDAAHQENIIEMAGRILTSGNSLLETVNSVLDLSKIEENKIELKYSKIQLANFVEGHIKLFEAYALKKKLKLVLNIHDDNLIVFLDEQILNQILNNLIGNAIKFTDKGSISVEIESLLRDDKTFASIKVIDTGVGIHADDLDKIFNAFTQVSEDLNHNSLGTGLGLTITKRFVEMMSGEILVNSEFGKGSVFNILFPASRNTELHKLQQNEKEPAPEPPKQSEPKLLPDVLAVENDEASREIIKFYLKNICRIQFTERGEEAIELAKNNMYKAILMDISLGAGLTGIETTKKIKKIFGYENIPIVALTAHAMVTDREVFLRAGCSHYLPKPFHRKDIVELMKNILR